MGWAKNRQIEQDEAGYSLDLSKDSLGVCPDCIADDPLRRFVASHADIQGCGFCGADGPQGLHLGALFDYMGKCLQSEWALAINELYYGDGDEAWESGGATVYDGYDLLGELDDPWPIRSCAPRSWPPSTRTGCPVTPSASRTMSAWPTAGRPSPAS